MTARASQIVSAATFTHSQSEASFNDDIPILHFQEWAPAWFYSALNWLGKSFLDAGNTEQSFGYYLFGSDVDPYAQLGATRLFVVGLQDGAYRMSVAMDASGCAPLPSGTRYPLTDAGILAMYKALAASPVFAKAHYCYVPGLLSGSDFAVGAATIESGYDPATGIRVIVEGSAVVQVVPLGDFQTRHNEQVYNSNPQIVPIVTTLVYDITQNNALGAKSFALPVYYARDLISGTYCINKFSATTTINSDPVNCGQTAVFPGGPGYDASLAVSLALTSTSVANINGTSVTTSTFSAARVVAQIPIGTSVELGVCTLTYAGLSPAAIFSRQRIVGFYCDDNWKTTLGVPIYDFGPSNGNFTATAAAQTPPTLVYGTADGFLNGGSLQNVLQKLRQATYLISTDRLVATLDDAIAVNETADGVGLSVTTAALDFTMSSTGGSTVVNQLWVPVLATVTTTPAEIVIPGQVIIGARALANPVGAVGGVEVVRALQPIGSGGNQPSREQLTPTTIQVPLTATVPQSVLAVASLSNIEIGTDFPQQAIGDGPTFAGETRGVVLNLTATDTPALAPFSLTLSSTGLTLAPGVTYTFTLLGSGLTVSGSDGSSSSAVLAAGANSDATHTFVGMAVYTSSVTTVELYPLLPLAIPAPAAGTDGVLAGTAYSVRLAYGATTCSYDIIDSTQTVVASGVSVATPQSVEGTTPQPGDLYFGSFIGGATSLTLWSLPIFLTVTPAQVAAAGFDGNMTLGAQVSGLPGYDLAITDSSLFVYSNINIDTAETGSVSSHNVYLASAVINSAPDSTGPTAFAPCRLLMGIIRQVQMGNVLVYAFVPEDDSVVIGGVRYILSVINLGAIGENPNTLPYPPSYWPSNRFWQFANRHNPYFAVQYTGETEAARLEREALETVLLGLEMRAAGEPMQLVLDTNSQEMIVWPIYAFPYATSTQSVDLGQLKIITTTILGLLNTTFPPASALTASQLGEQILVPQALQQNNPYVYGVSESASSSNGSPIVMSVAAAPQIDGQLVTNLSPNTISPLKSAPSASEAALAKSLQAVPEVVQARTVGWIGVTQVEDRRPQTIYGFSVYNPATGEAYIVEVVDADLEVPDQLPLATENATYDPYYVRVVFLNTLTCYNMSIIVPSMARDQYGYLAKPEVAYQNVLGKTIEYDLGYIYQLADAGGGFDRLEFVASGSAVPPAGPSYLYTNLPYALRGGGRRQEASASFICRRRNWNAECLPDAGRAPGGQIRLPSVRRRRSRADASRCRRRGRQTPAGAYGRVLIPPQR